MAAQQQTPMSARLPPDVPSDPEISTSLTNYLRTFALWCRNGFAEQMRNNEALQGLMLRGYDTPAGQNPKIWMLEVNQAGQLGLGPMALGSQADPGAFVPVVPAGPPMGVTDGSNAPAGAIGEVISNVRVVASALTLANTVAQNVCTITLTPGDWDVQGNAWFSIGTTATNIHAGINSVSATVPLDASLSVVRYTENVALNGGGQMRTLSPCRVNVTAPTPYYLYGSVNFPSGTCTAYGALWARRMR